MDDVLKDDRDSNLDEQLDDINVGTEVHEGSNLVNTQTLNNDVSLKEHEGSSVIGIVSENSNAEPKESNSLIDVRTDNKKEGCHYRKRKWLCVLGCALVHFVIGGFERSNGILYLHIRDRYGASASEIAWVISLSVTLKLLFGPVASMLCSISTPRFVVITGAILFTSGIILAAYLPSFSLLYLSYGVITGIGKSLVYQPGLVVVGQQFPKKRGIAVGLATAGGGIGTLILPPLFEVLLEWYGFTGGLLIVSGLVLNTCISGMLYQTVVHHKKSLCRQSISHSYDCVHNDEENASDLTEDHTMQIKEPERPLSSRYCHKFWISRCLRSCQYMKGTDQSDKKKMLDLSLLRRPDFLMFCVGIGFLALSFNSMLVFIPPLAGSRGLSGVQGAYIMSVAGVFDTIGRIASGFILELKRLKVVRKVIYNFIMFLLALVIFSLPFIVTFAEFCVVAGVFGLLIGTYTSQKSVILADIVGTESLSSSFGILIFFQGIGTLMGPPVTGIFKDIYNSYADGFYFIGGTTFIGALILLLSNTVKCGKQAT